MSKKSQFIDKFEVIRRIGTGYTADVYEAQQNGTRFAIKLFKKDASEFAESEFENARMLLHPNIIEYDSHKRQPVCRLTDQTSNSNAIVMELAQNGEMFELVEKCQGLPQFVARTYFHMLIDALEYIHDCGIAHLDIKAENLLLDQFYTLKISDFGFSMKNSQPINRKVGTEGYMSPEIQNNQPFYGHEADIFAAGVVLFIITTGFQPFKSTRSDDIYFKALNSTPQRFWNTYNRKELSYSFRDLIQKMLNKDRKKRLSLTEIKQHPWYSEDILMAHDLKREVETLLETSS